MLVVIALAWLYGVCSASSIIELRGHDGHMGTGGSADLYVRTVGVGSPENPPNITVCGEHCELDSFSSLPEHFRCKTPVLHSDALARAVFSGWDRRYIHCDVVVTTANYRTASCSFGGGCSARFNLQNTPNITEIFTPIVEAGSVIRYSGRNIDVGSTSSQGSAAMTKADIVDTGPITIPLATRDDSDNAHVATWYWQAGAKVSYHLPPGYYAGYYNISVHYTRQNMGSAVLVPTARQVDLENGNLYDIVLVARIHSVSPTLGSLAGGTVCPSTPSLALCILTCNLTNAIHRHNACRSCISRARASVVIGPGYKLLLRVRTAQ